MTEKTPPHKIPKTCGGNIINIEKRSQHLEAAMGIKPTAAYSECLQA